MKKIIITLLVFINITTNAQDQPKDTIKTEVIEVITSYTPKVTDAEKIKRIPKIEFSRNTDKKKLEYTFKIKPVASTFVPKGVQMKVIKQEEKERIFDNYIKGGFGNSFTPYIDLNLHKNSAFNYEYGLQLTGIYSENLMEDELSSTYFNSKLDLFYKKEGNYYDWLVKTEFSFDGYKWYGIPKNTIKFDETVVKIIDKKSSQRYNDYKLSGQLDFDELYIETVKGNINFFHDSYFNKEISLGASTLFIFPLKRIRDFKPKDLKLNTSLKGIMGGFKNGYNSIEKEEHQFVSFNINPYYEWKYKRLKSKVGFETTVARDLVNSKMWYLINPDVHFNLSLSKNNSNSFYLGAKGGIKQNSYKELSRENPFMSPTHAILPTNEKYNGYLGFKGIISGKFNYNVSTNYSLEEDKVMYVANKSKSDGIRTSDLLNNIPYEAYEYGNSFGLAYDDITTLSINTELEYVVNAKLNMGVIGNYSMYTMDKMEYTYNLPQIKAQFFTKYRSKRWFSGVNVYYVGDRKDLQYSTPNLPESIDIDAYFSLNVDAGYHISESITLFAKGTNLTNNSYEQFTNYQAQGLLVIGGVIFKFDQLTKSKKVKKLKRIKRSKLFKRKKLKKFKRIKRSKLFKRKKLMRTKRKRRFKWFR